MTEQEILLAAANNILPTEKMNPAEEILWFKARDLYKAYNTGFLLKELGIKRKNDILRDFRAAKAKEKTFANLYETFSKLMINASQATSEYAKNRTLENADAMYYAIYRMLPKQD